MNVVDSSGWLEYFSGGENAAEFAGPLQDTDHLVVPSISIYEVFKVILREATEDDALQAVAAMQRGRISSLTSELAMAAASLSLDIGLPMADSMILATAREHSAILWTQDSDFRGLPDVKYLPKA